MVVFPEISIPYNWLKLIADFSKLNDIAIVFGMEHFSISKNQVSDSGVLFKSILISQVDVFNNFDTRYVV